MNKLSFILCCVIAAMTMVIASLGYIIVSDPIPRLARFPTGDSINENGNKVPFKIVCKAYSNRPNETLQPPYDEHYIGFEMISDCTTVPN